jgi:hypothetical protein
MKHLFVLSLLLGLGWNALAQEDASVAERARLAAQRAQVEAALKAEEKTCNGKFAVNECLAAARVKSRQALAELRKQEISINDAERKRKAAQRQQAQDERALSQRQRQEAEQGRPAGQAQAREGRASDKTASHAAQQALGPANAARQAQHVEERQAQHEADRVRHASELAKNQAQNEKRLADAADRKEKRDKRLADRKKPAAQPLPVPP